MKLETSVELLERVRAKHGASWYGLAALLDTHKNTVYNWKGGHTVVDRRFAPRIAELLEERPEYVLLCLENEREPSPELRKIWHRLASLITSRAACIVLSGLAVVGLSALPTSESCAASGFGGFAHTTSYVILAPMAAPTFRPPLPRSVGTDHSRHPTNHCGAGFPRPFS